MFHVEDVETLKPVWASAHHFGIWIMGCLKLGWLQKFIILWESRFLHFKEIQFQSKQSPQSSTVLDIRQKWRHIGLRLRSCLDIIHSAQTVLEYWLLIIHVNSSTQQHIFDLFPPRFCDHFSFTFMRLHPNFIVWFSYHLAKYSEAPDMRYTK